MSGNEREPGLSTLIYHIADTNHWERAQVSQYYTHPSLQTEGYIHCSTRAQVEETANFYFADRDDILVIFIDTSRLEAELVYEEATRGGEYPHIYGAINISSVVGSKKFRKRGKKFKISLPEQAG